MGSFDMYVIYGTKDCKWCNKAKELATSEGIFFRYVDLHKDKDSFDFLLKNGLKTVPQVFKDGVHIGGYTDFKESLE